MMKEVQLLKPVNNGLIEELEDILELVRSGDVQDLVGVVGWGDGDVTTTYQPGQHIKIEKICHKLSILHQDICMHEILSNEDSFTSEFIGSGED